MKPILLLILILLAMNTYSQSELPLSEVKENPEKYSATLVVSRMIEGAGLRYYWATHELRPEDLDFKPSEEARTCRETLEHIHGLSQTILSASNYIPRYSCQVFSVLGKFIGSQHKIKRIP